MSHRFHRHPLPVLVTRHWLDGDYTRSQGSIMIETDIQRSAEGLEYIHTLRWSRKMDSGQTVASVSDPLTSEKLFASQHYQGIISTTQLYSCIEQIADFHNKQLSACSPYTPTSKDLITRTVVSNSMINRSTSSSGNVESGAQRSVPPLSEGDTQESARSSAVCYSEAQQAKLSSMGTFPEWALREGE